MSPYQTARTIYASLKDDANALDQIRAARNALALSLATDGAASLAVTSATMNGQSFAGMVGMKPTQRLAVLNLVCRMAYEKSAISSTVEPLL